jgi:type I restriction enzyme R subunit
MTDRDDAYLAREARARRKIDEQLTAAGWTVQGKDEIDVSAGPGVATREFPLEKPHGRVDYLLSSTANPSG